MRGGGGKGSVAKHEAPRVHAQSGKSRRKTRNCPNGTQRMRTNLLQGSLCLLQLLFLLLEPLFELVQLLLPIVEPLPEGLELGFHFGVRLRLGAFRAKVLDLGLEWSTHQSAATSYRKRYAY